MAEPEISRDVSWLPEIILAMRQHGGSASLAQLYRWVERQRTNLPPTYQAVVRATIYAHSSDARPYVQGNPDVFQKVGRGEWGLRRLDENALGHSSAAHAVVFALQGMTNEEIRSFVGRAEELKADLEKRVAEYNVAAIFREIATLSREDQIRALAELKKQLGD